MAAEIERSTTRKLTARITAGEQLGLGTPHTVEVSGLTFAALAPTMAVALRPAFSSDIGSHRWVRFGVAKLHPGYSAPYIGMPLASKVSSVLGIGLWLATCVGTISGFPVGATSLGVILVYPVLDMGTFWPSPLRPLGRATAVPVAVRIPVPSAVVLGLASYASAIPRPRLSYSLEPDAVVAMLLLAGAES